MRWVPILFLIIRVHSVPANQKKPKIYMASIDLDSSRKHRDPEVIVDIGSQLPPVKRNVTLANDYGDYEDYELTEKSELTTTPMNPPTEKKNGAESTLLDSQFKPHLKISLKTEPKSSDEVRDEVSRLMGDLHREELTIRTTVTKEDMTTTMDPMVANMSMFFQEEEGSGVEFSEDELLNMTSSTTTRKPLLFTTVIQEVKSVPVTSRPDPFEHVDYDLTDHSNIPKPKSKKKKLDRLKKYKSLNLHGGAVDKPEIHPTIASVIVKPKRRKTLRKLKKIDKFKKVKSLNHRLRAQNRMRLRKVFSKMVFRSRDRVASGNRSTKLKFVGSNGVVTPAPFNIDTAIKLDSVDGKTKRSRRDKRDTGEAHLQDLEAPAIDTEPETIPLESSIIDAIHEEPHPAYHLIGRTQVEPSPMVNEAQEEEYSEEQEAVPLRSGLVQVSLEGNSVRNEIPRRLKMVPLKTIKKVHKYENTDGYALVVPNAKKPTMLELLIGDFLGRLPPTARSPSFSQEQWS